MARVALLHLLRSQSRRHLSANTPSAYHCFWSVTCGRRIGANPTFRTSSQLPAAQTRWASRSQATNTEEDNMIGIGPRIGGQSGEEDNKETGVVYEGPNSIIIRKVKLMPLGICCPPVAFFLTSPHVNVMLNNNGALAASAIFIFASTTAALHWFLALIFTNSGGSLVQTASRWR